MLMTSTLSMAALSVISISSSVSLEESLLSSTLLFTLNLPPASSGESGGVKYG